MGAPQENPQSDPLEDVAESFLARIRAGQRPAVSEYQARFPELAGEIRDLCSALLMMEEGRACIDKPAPGPAARPESTPLPQRLGEYRLVREVGRGGMGVVYEAVQESLDRHIALKILPHQSFQSSEQLERFRREARAAARLHHTNIVPVFGVGEDQGVHYYVMQFINGQGLDSVLDEVRRLRRAGDSSATEAPAKKGREPLGSNVLDPFSPAAVAQSILSGRFPQSSNATEIAGSATVSPSTGSVPPAPAGASTSSYVNLQGPYYASVARIGLQAAEALAYAHSQGVIHRDIKPSNLLLDNEGRVWITDFGLARMEEAGPLTPSGDVLGTVRYMAPERFRGQADARSDVYALGATLYELLTLRPAFDHPYQATLVEQIIHRDPPTPRKLDPRMPRDLETTILKALAKEPGQRYATAEDMAEDLRRFLTDLPIRARRTLWPEQAWRWCRRNPAVASLLGSVAVLLMTIALVASLAAWRLQLETNAKDQALTEATRAGKRAEQANARAQRRLVQIEKSNQILTEIFADLDIRQVQARSEPLEAVLAKRLVKAAAELEEEAVGDPLVVAGLQGRLGITLLHLGYPREALPLLVKARAVYKELQGSTHLATLISSNNLALGYSDSEKLDLAVPLLEETLTLMRATLGPDHPNTLCSMNNLAVAYHDAWRLDLAVPLFEKTLQLRKAKLPPDHPNTLTTMCNLAMCYQAAGKLDRALPLFEDTFRRSKATLGADHADTLMCMARLASCYRATGSPHRAVPLYEEALRLSKARLGSDHPTTLASMNGLALCYQAAGKPDRALPLYQEALKLRRAKLGPDHHATFASMESLASGYQAVGNLNLAVPLFEEALKLRKAKLGIDHPDTLTSMGNLAEAYRADGKLDRALSLRDETLRLMKARLGIDHPRTLVCMTNLGNCYRDVKMLDKATALHEETWKLMKAKLGVDHPDTLACLNNLAVDYRDAGKLDRAVPLWEEALRLKRAKLGSEHPGTLTSMNNLAWGYQATGRPEQALPLFQEAAAGVERMRFQHEHAESIVQNLIGCYERLRQFNEAEVWRRKLAAWQKERETVKKG